jgi:hypothetical protein
VSQTVADLHQVVTEATSVELSSSQNLEVDVSTSSVVVVNDTNRLDSTPVCSDIALVGSRNSC